MSKVMRIETVVWFSCILLLSDCENDEVKEDPCVPESECDLCNLEELCGSDRDCGSRLPCEGSKVTLCGYIDYNNANEWKFHLRRYPRTEDSLMIEVYFDSMSDEEATKTIFQGFKKGDRFSRQVHVTGCLKGWDDVTENECSRWVYLFIISRDNIYFE